MQPSKLITRLIPTVLALSVSTSTLATSEDYEVGFTTVPDIEISENSALDFGNFLELASGSTCTLPVTGSANADTYPGDSAMKLAVASATSVGADYQKLSSCGLAGATDLGTVGLYEISGVAGGSVSVTVHPVTDGADFNFTPVGCVGNYDGAANGDSCELLKSDGSATDIVLASGGDTVGNTAGGIPAVGKSLIAVGGTITSTALHSAGQELTQSFTIEVTY